MNDILLFAAKLLLNAFVVSVLVSDNEIDSNVNTHFWSISVNIKTNKTLMRVRYTHLINLVLDSFQYG